MRPSFYNIIILFQWACMLSSAGFSVRLIGNEHIPKYMKHFYWYSFVAAFVSTLSLLEKRFLFVDKLTWGYISNSLLLFHFIFLSSFIHGFLKNAKMLKVMRVLFFSFVFLILFFLFTNDLSIQISTAFATTNFGLVVFCCFYYFQLFDAMPTLNLLKEPSFWVINGIFFCMCATIPILAIRYYLIDRMHASVYSTIEVVIPFVYGVMHLFFIKAYICSVSQCKA